MKIIRVGNYTTGFKYYKNKVEITNSDEIDKIKLLKIPPAYDNVTIVNNKKIIAYGYDSKNRKQVIYNPKYIAKQNIIKYKKISGSINFFSKLKKKIANDLNSNDEKIYTKYNQLTSLGFYNVFIYTGGLFEWLLLQDIYGVKDFPTTKKELDLLKYKPNKVFGIHLLEY